MEIVIFGKKGIFFTFTSIILMAALIIIFTPSPTQDITADAKTAKTRVNAINDFVVDLESSYLENIMRVSSHKAFLALISYIDANGPFSDLNELKSRFSELVINGTIDNVLQTEMADNTIINWTQRMVNISSNTLNINSEFTVNSVQISQLRPFFVELNLDISFSIDSETVSWNISEFIVNAELNIQGFDDPYYVTDGDYINKINKTNVESNEWNTAKVLDHIAYGTYRFNEEAPSFLQRFTSPSLSSGCCGIESIVDSTKVSSSQKDVSYADYIFWKTSSDCPNLNLYTASGISPNVKFDSPHLISYNLTEDSSQICPT